MKPKPNAHRDNPGYRPSIFYFLIPFLVCFFCANAQVKKPAEKPVKKEVATTLAPVKTTAVVVAKTTEIDKPPVARNMEEFKKTPQYAKRKARLKATPGPKPAEFKFSDGSKVTVSLDRKTPTDIVGGTVTKKVGKEYDKKSAGGLDCTTQNIVLSVNSSDFLASDYSGMADHIYPGACYTYGNLTSGDWNEQRGERNPLQITTDNPNTKVAYVNVKDPNDGELKAAVTKIFSGMNRTNANGSSIYQVSHVENSAAYNLQIGASASGYGIDISNVYGTMNQSTHAHVTIDFTAILFTISTIPPDNGFFKDPKVEEIPYLDFIGDVSYGVRVLANADFTFASQAEADNFKASVSDFGVTASLGVGVGSSSKSTQITINSDITGGPGGHKVAYSIKELQKQIDKAVEGATYQNARPIKYKAYNMAGDVMFTHSITDEQPVRTCTPTDGGSPEIESVQVTFTQGNDGKEPPTDYFMSLNSGMNDAGEDQMFVYEAARSGENHEYKAGSIVTVFLKPNKGYEKIIDGKKVKFGYKGKLDLASLQKAGGHLYVSPINYNSRMPGANGNIGYDIWKIDNVTIQIRLKPTPVIPNPDSLLPKNPLSWSLMGADELQLDSRNQTTGRLYFDGGLAQTGHQ
jgi:hypothetical protein